MSLNRRAALAQLATNLGAVAEVMTVVRHYAELDITQYTEAELPLIGIKEPGESPDEEMTSMRAVMNLETKLRVYFVCWGINPTATYETLVKAIRDKIGSDFTLTLTATKSLVTDISEIDGEMPLYFFDMDISIKYYLNQQAT